eukprot:38384-Pelagomonas_calceolata.AAC.1
MLDENVSPAADEPDSQAVGQPPLQCYHCLRGFFSPDRSGLVQCNFASAKLLTYYVMPSRHHDVQQRKPFLSFPFLTSITRRQLDKQ